MTKNMKWCAFLFLAAGLYCHRFYGADFRLEGDAAQNVYLRLNEDIVKAGYDPYQRDYFPSLPITGLYNPALRAVSWAFGLLARGLDPVARALYVCMATSWLLESLLGCSVFLFLDFAGASPPASLLGAFIVCFTGFHLIGIREFDHMYLVSFLCVPPLLISFLNLCLKGGARAKRFWTCAAAAWLGLSLLGGSNVPMFLYLPVFLLIPLFRFLGDGDADALLVNAAHMAAALLLAGLAASPVIVPGAWYNGLTVRSLIGFKREVIPAAQSLQTMLIRDWGFFDWKLSDVHYHERDWFLGLPVLMLAAAGARARLKRTWAVLDAVLASCAVWACVIFFQHRLPRPLSAAIVGFFKLQSIRFPDRLLLLLLLPASYFAAAGFDGSGGVFFPFVSACLILLNLLLLFEVRLQAPELPQDALAAAALALACAFIGAGALLLRRRRPSRALSALAVGSVFAMYYFAPIQRTLYPHRQQERSERPLSLMSLAGFSRGYGAAAAAASKRFFETPGFLKDPRLEGSRLYDPGETATHFHGRGAGQEFVLATLDDPAALLKNVELSRIIDEDVLNLMGVAWELRASTGAAPALRRRRGFLPKLFVAPGITALKDDGEVLAAMKAAGTSDFRGTVYVNCAAASCEGLPASSGADPAERPVKLLREAPGRFAALVPEGREGVLFVSIPHHPGWEARVNGRPVPVSRANHAFMAIPVGGQASEIEWEFRRDLAGYCGLLSAGTFLSLLGLMARLRKNR